MTLLWKRRLGLVGATRSAPVRSAAPPELFCRHEKSPWCGAACFSTRVSSGSFGAGPSPPSCAPLRVRWRSPAFGSSPFRRDRVYLGEAFRASCGASRSRRACWRPSSISGRHCGGWSYGVFSQPCEPPWDGSGRTAQVAFQLGDFASGRRAAEGMDLDLFRLNCSRIASL